MNQELQFKKLFDRIDNATTAHPNYNACAWDILESDFNKFLYKIYDEEAFIYYSPHPYFSLLASLSIIRQLIKNGDCCDAYVAELEEKVDKARIFLADQGISFEVIDDE